MQIMEFLLNLKFVGLYQNRFRRANPQLFLAMCPNGVSNNLRDFTSFLFEQ